MASLKSINYGKLDIPNIEDAFDMLSRDVFKGNGTEVRLVGPFYEMHYHSVEGEAASGKKFFALVPCINWSLSKQDKQECHCPYCEAGIPIVRKFYVNVIHLDSYDNKLFNFDTRTSSEKQIRTMLDDFKSFCKDPESQSYTPVKVLGLTTGVIRKMKELEDSLFKRNPDGTKEYYTLDDLQNGPILQFKYNADSGVSPANRYSVQRVDGSYPITKEMRKALLLYDIADGEKLYPTRDELVTKLKRDASKIKNGGEGLEKFKTQQSSSNSSYKTTTQTISADVDDIDVAIAPAPKNALESAEFSESDLDDIPF